MACYADKNTMEIVEENGNGGGDVNIEIRQGQGLLSSYQAMASNGFSVSKKHSIFKIPNTLYRHKKNAYLPNGFSFGPWHYGKPYLQAAQAVKYEYLKRLIHRCRNPSQKLQGLEAAVWKVENQARECYAGSIELSQEEFVKMLVLDSCFIIELLISYYTVLSINPISRNGFLEKLQQSSNNGDIFPSAFEVQFIYHDLILLENQIPWFVLEILFEFIDPKPINSLKKLAVDFFKNIFSYDRIHIAEAILEQESVEHILDLLRKCMFMSFLRDEKMEQSLLTLLKGLVPKCLTMTPIRTTMYRHFLDRENGSLRELETQIPSASRLKEAGVKFQRAGYRPMLDVRFRKGVIQLPHLLIHSTTESLFRNLIAFEHCHWHCHPIVTSYAKLMDDLIDTVEDVDILSKNGVICNLLNPEDATQFFNLLCSDTHISHLHYGEIYWEVNSYCRRLWPRRRAFYIHNYFAKPWAIVSQIFALVILTLTILQVVQK